ncbi:adenylate kinase related protein [Nucleospora cyclopteri]
MTIDRRKILVIEKEEHSELDEIETSNHIDDRCACTQRNDQTDNITEGKKSHNDKCDYTSCKCNCGRCKGNDVMGPSINRISSSSSSNGNAAINSSINSSINSNKKDNISNPCDKQSTKCIVDIPECKEGIKKAKEIKNVEDIIQVSRIKNEINEEIKNSKSAVSDIEDLIESKSEINIENSKSEINIEKSKSEINIKNELIKNEINEEIQNNKSEINEEIVTDNKINGNKSIDNKDEEIKILKKEKKDLKKMLGEMENPSSGKQKLENDQKIINRKNQNINEKVKPCELKNAVNQVKNLAQEQRTKKKEVDQFEKNLKVAVEQDQQIKECETANKLSKDYGVPPNTFYTSEKLLTHCREDSKVLEYRQNKMVVAEGPMWKKRAIFKCFWHQKYFVLLKNGLFVYHKLDGSKFPKGNYNVKLMELNKSLDFGGIHPYRINIGGGMFFAFDDQEERDYWYEKIERLRQQLTTGNID